MTGADALAQRARILEYTPGVVNLEAPASSRVLTKGIHEGPALDAIQTSDVLEWANAERAAAPGPGDGGPILETAQFLPRICTGGLPDNAEGTCPINNVSLDDLQVAGAKIQFVVQSLGSGLYMTNLRLVPGGSGAFMEHPLFVSWPADGSEPKADTIDRFFNVKMNLAVSATPEEQQIGGGTAAFVGFLSSDKLSIHFKNVSVFQAEEGGPALPTGCAKLPEFKANAAQTLQTNCAAQCHAGGQPNARSAVNMTNLLSANDDDVLAACNEIRNRINFQDLNNSGLFLAPIPGGTNHPFQFPTQGAYDTFKASVTTWADAEKTSAGI